MTLMILKIDSEDYDQIRTGEASKHFFSKRKGSENQILI